MLTGTTFLPSFGMRRRKARKLISYVVTTKSKGKKNVLVLATHPLLLGETKDDEKY